MTTRKQIMDFVEQNGPQRRKDIIKFIVENNGHKYDPIKDRGYYACAFWKTFGYVGSRYAINREYDRYTHRYGYLLCPSYKGDKRYLKKNEQTKRYEIAIG